jgi:glycerate dehydrogenase
MKAVFLDFATMGGDLDLTPLREVTSDLEIYDTSTPAEAVERIADASIVYTNKINLSDELIAAAPGLKFIGLTATGTDNIDIASAEKHGIAVCNIRSYCTASVTEHVMGALLSLTHSLPGFQQSVAAGEWQTSDSPFLLAHSIRELSVMTLGIVGYGELGRGVARAAKAFGMNVIVSARPGSSDTPPGRVAFDTMLAEADVISLHCPLNEQTRRLFGAAQFARMRNDAILINTARGGLVDSAALVAALEAGQIGAAAVDVLPIEPPVDGDPLLEYTGCNLIVTPHIAWASNVARQNAIDELAANARAFIDGERRNRVV